MSNGEWKPITDLPAGWETLASDHLPHLIAAWEERRERLKDSPALKEFHSRFSRQWAIETGIIENLYDISRGTTLLLIEKGLEASLIQHGESDRPAHEIVALLKDQQETLEGLRVFIAQERDLSTSYIKELHGALTRHQPSTEALNQRTGQLQKVELLRGEWKSQPNNPSREDGFVHLYCPPEHVTSEMDRLVSMHHEHTAQRIPVDLEAAWLHHRFTQIHPFQDGNGRVARTLATLVFLREAWFPLIVDRKQRAEYIEALEAADAGDLEPLVRLFAQSQTQGLLMAVSIADDTLRPERRLQSEIEAIRGRLQQRQQQNLAFMERVFGVGAILQESVLNRFSSIAFELNTVFSELNTGAEAQAQSSTTSHDYWYQGDVLEIAKGLGYVANTREYRAWQRIRVRESNGEQFEMVVHFHSVGFDFVGILGASAFAVVRTGRETARVMLGERGFQFACTESQEGIAKRFSEWFEEAVLVGLETYRRRL